MMGEKEARYKSVKQETMETNRSSTVDQSEKHEHELGHRKRKSMTDHAFNALFKEKRISIIAGDKELGKPKRLPEVGNKKNFVGDTVSFAMGKSAIICAPEAVSSPASEGQRGDSMENRVAFSKRLREDRDPIKKEYCSCDETDTTDSHNNLVTKSGNGASLIEDRVGSKASENRHLNISCKENEGNLIDSELEQSKCLVEASPLKGNDRKNQFNSEQERDSSSIFSGKEQLKEPKYTRTVKSISEAMKKFEKKCDKRMRRLVQKHETEIQELNKLWDQKWLIMEKSHEQVSAVNNSMQRFSGRIDNLDALNSEFDKMKEEYKHQREMFLKDLEQTQLAEINEERKKAAHWITELKSELKLASKDRADGEPSWVETIKSETVVTNTTSENDSVIISFKEAPVNRVELSNINGETDSSSVSANLLSGRPCDSEKKVSDDVCTLSRAEATAYDSLKDRGVDNFVDPGPLEATVLTSHANHRARYIWAGQPVESLSFRHGTTLPSVLDARIQQRLAVAGFLGIHLMGRLQYDWPLFEALIERWRPETHSFHLPVGEMTITLQDIGLLSGLPIDGVPVTSSEATLGIPQWQSLCEELLGVVPPYTEIDGSSIKLKWIQAHFSQFAKLPDDATQIVIDMYTRAYIMIALGATVMPDRSGNKVKLLYLPLLRDIERIHSYSWGGAALAFLYRELCSATSPGTSQCGGFLTILQLWAWDRLLCTQPQSLRPNEDVVQGDMPLGCRWMGPLSYKYITAHNLQSYRDQLASLTEDQVVWQPYRDRQAPAYCRQGEAIWRSRVPLICFDRVEWHFPDRVLRQFGMLQKVPADCDTNEELHKIDRRGNIHVIWATRHQKYIELWDTRVDRVVQGKMGDELMDYTHPYMIWYRKITCMFVHNPRHIEEVGYKSHAPFFEGLVQNIQRIHEINEAAIAQQVEVDESRLRVRSLIIDSLTQIRWQQRLEAVAPPAPVDRVQGVAPRQGRVRHPRAPRHPLISKRS